MSDAKSDTDEIEDGELPEEGEISDQSDHDEPKATKTNGE